MTCLCPDVPIAYCPACTVIHPNRASRKKPLNIYRLRPALRRAAKESA